MKSLLIFLFVFIGHGLQAHDNQHGDEGQGQLISLRLVLGEKSAKLFLIGNESAKVNFGDDKKILTITAFKDDSKKEELKFEPGKGYYTIKKMPKWKTPYSLQVLTEVRGKKESVKVKVKP